MEIATTAIAVGTFLAIIVALFRDEITALWRRPKIETRIKLSAPDCHLTRLIQRDIKTGEILAKMDCYYLRLWIENAGRIRAEQVQVFVASLSKKQADGTYKRNKDFLPMNLKWSHASPLDPVIFTSLNPKMGRHCDLGHIIDPDHGSLFALDQSGAQEGETTISLDLEFEPATYSHLIPPGDYRIELLIGGANFRPVRKRLELAHTGEWYPSEDRMFSDGLGLTVLD